MAINIPEINFVMPSNEELAAKALANPTAMHNWLGAVEASEIPSPRTVMLPFSIEAQHEICEGAGDEKGVADLRALVRGVREAGEQFGYPLFMKTSLFSGKHDWEKTCFITAEDTDESILKKMGEQTHFWMMFGSGYATHLAVREMIETKPVFHAFVGNMPITQEFRLFTKNGEVEGYQPYWPLKAFKDHYTSIENVEEALQSIATPSPELLDKMIEYTNRLSDKLEGDWSVDFLINKDGDPVLIDMAEAHKSFRCDVGYVQLNEPEQKIKP